MAQRPIDEEVRELAVAAFPFEREETTGAQALAMWQQLREAGRGAPVVLGGDGSLISLSDAFHPAWPGRRAAAEILATAAGLRHPGDLAAKLTKDNASARRSLMEHLNSQPAGPLPEFFVPDASGRPRQLTPDEVRALLLAEPQPPPVGEWPSETDPSPGLSVAREAGRPLPKVHIALTPTDDWTTIPAHLNWGGWNSCPRPEYHVAALRSWRDRFGAELVGLSHDVMNLRVARRPATREAALELAREHYLYCNDIVEQGTGTLSRLAASLAADDWWYFWWD